METHAKQLTAADLSSVAIVILSWNGREYLQQFLPSVIRHSGNAQVIVADNASTDDTVSYLASAFPSVRVIQNDVNGGFAEGYNRALGKVTAKYYLLLNQDVEVTENWIAPLLEVMEQNDKVAACQPKLRAYHEQERLEYAGAAGGFIDKYGYPFCRGRIFDTEEQDIGQYNDFCRIFWASGACMMVRSSVYNMLGGFDSDFFAHMEEIDLCWRIQLAGFSIYYIPHSVVYHVGAGSLRKNSALKTYLNYRNNLWLITKNQQGNWRTTLFIRFCLDIISAYRSLLLGDVTTFTSIASAHREFLKGFSKMKRKRDTIQLNSCPIPNGMIYNGSIVADYFLRGKRKFSDLVWK